MTPPRDPRQGWLLGCGPAAGARLGHGVEQLGLDLGAASSSCTGGLGDAVSRATTALQGLGPADRAQLAAAWRAWLIAAYPARDRAKAIARDFEVSTRTAESWLASDAPAPSGTVLATAIRRHGLVVVARVIAPGTPFEQLAQVLDVEATADALDAKLRALTAELERLR